MNTYLRCPTPPTSAPPWRNDAAQSEGEGGDDADAGIAEEVTIADEGEAFAEEYEEDFVWEGTEHEEAQHLSAAEVGSDIMETQSPLQSITTPPAMESAPAITWPSTAPSSSAPLPAAPPTAAPPTAAPPSTPPPRLMLPTIPHPAPAEVADSTEPPRIFETIHFEKAAMGRIIGPAGTRIKTVRQQSNAEVRVKGVSDTCEVQIAGTFEQVQKAKALITELAESEKCDQPDSIPQRETRHHRAVDGDFDKVEDQEVLVVSQEDAKKIIGRGGATITRMRTDSSAIIKINTDSEPNTATISGTIEAVDLARSMIYDVLRSTGRGDDVQWESEEFLQVPFEASKKIIGKGGANISKIEQTTWANVEVEKTEGETRLVRIAGSLEAVDKAISMIQGFIDVSGWQDQKQEQQWSKTDWSKDDWNGKNQKRKWKSDDWQDWKSGGKKHASEQGKEWPEE